MASELIVTVSWEWEAREKRGASEKDYHDLESSSCGTKFGNPKHTIPITTIVTLWVVVLGAGLNLVWAQNSRLREMERDHAIRMKLHDLRMKGMDHSRAIAEMNARLEEQKEDQRMKEGHHSRTIADVKSLRREQKKTETNIKANGKGDGEMQQHEELRAAALAGLERQMREQARMQLFWQG